MAARELGVQRLHPGASVPPVGCGCWVRVLGAPEDLPPASDHEQAVLRCIGAPPNVRLACQLRPTGTIAVTPLLPPTATARDGFAQAMGNQGAEREIAILFADLRGFTKLSEHKLPYDVVFLLNRYLPRWAGRSSRRVVGSTSSLAMG